MTYEWMAPEDATLRSVETDGSPLEVGALCLFEAGPLLDRDGRFRLDDLRRHLEAGLGHVPRLRQIAVMPPLGQGRPAWVDDPHFDLADHVHVAALPGPGGRAELRQFVRRVLETPLEPDRPLWEFWFVEGVEGGRVAVLPKFSHIAADGIAVLTFALSLLTFEPDPHPIDVVEPWTAAPAPGAAALAAGAVVDGVRRQASSFAGIAAALARPDRLAARAARIATGIRSAAGIAPRLPITRAVGRHRDFAWVSLSMDGVRAAAHARGVTINDVVLAIVADALGTGMARDGLSRDGIRPRVIVPVSSRRDDGSGVMGNSYSFILAHLPVGTMSPLERLDLVHGETERAKASGETDVGALLLALGGVIPMPLLRRAAPTLLRHQPVANLAVSNLAGSPVPLYLLGSRLLEAYPFISLTGNIGVIIGVLSHEGALGVGITTDPDLVDDVDVLAGDVHDAASALFAAQRDAGALDRRSDARPGGSNSGSAGRRARRSSAACITPTTSS